MTAPWQPLWQRYVAWFDARNSRERAIVAASVLFLILYPAYLYLIEPAVINARKLSAEAQQQRAAAAQLQSQIAMLQAQAHDPEAALRKTLADLRQQIAAQEPRFKVVEQSMVPAAKVVALLERLLVRNRSLQLVSLKSLPPTPLVERKAAPDAGTGVPEANVYNHGIEIAVSGGYGDLLSYLSELEKSPQRVLWGKLVLDASDHSHIVMTLTLNTLSLDQAWLAL